MRYPINIPHLYAEDKAYAKEAIDSGWISAKGPYVERLENEFAKWCNRSYATTVSNGSSALLTALYALNLPKGSEVILPATTIVSCYNAIVQNGLKPVFADVYPDTWTITPASVADKITDNTSAILVVDLYGNMVNTEHIANVARSSGLKIIEDAAEAHGAYDKNYRAGQFGDVSIFSFYANKIVTSGEGGMLLTDDVGILNRAKNFKNLFFSDQKLYCNTDVGYNLRMTNVQCAMALGQLENVETTIQHRRRIAARYNENFKDSINIKLPVEKPGHRNVYWYYSILLTSGRDKVMRALDDAEIDYRSFFKPLHKQEFVNTRDSLPVSEYLYTHGLNLPTYNDLTNEDIDYISAVVLQALENE